MSEVASVTPKEDPKEVWVVYNSKGRLRGSILCGGDYWIPYAFVSEKGADMWMKRHGEGFHYEVRKMHLVTPPDSEEDD